MRFHIEVQQHSTNTYWYHSFWDRSVLWYQCHLPTPPSSRGQVNPTILYIHTICKTIEILSRFSDFNWSLSANSNLVNYGLWKVNKFIFSYTVTYGIGRSFLRISSTHNSVYSFLCLMASNIINLVFYRSNRSRA